MPDYIYRCVICKRDYPVNEPMVTEIEHHCEVCGLRIYRKPQPVSVHWASGLPPSAGEFSPEIQHHLDHVDEIREKTDEYYYDRDQNKND